MFHSYDIITSHTYKEYFESSQDNVRLDFPNIRQSTRSLVVIERVQIIAMQDLSLLSQWRASKCIPSGFSAIRYTRAADNSENEISRENAVRKSGSPVVIQYIDLTAAATALSDLSAYSTDRPHNTRDARRSLILL